MKQEKRADLGHPYLALVVAIGFASAGHPWLALFAGCAMYKGLVLGALCLVLMLLFI